MLRDTPGQGPQEGIHPDMEFVSNVLDREPSVVVAFLDRMSCIQRILAAKNRSLGSPLTATELEDVGQEVLLLVWRKLPDFRGHSRLETWVYRIAVLEYMNRLRRASYRRTRDVSSHQLIDAAGSSDSPTVEDYAFVYDALDQLPETERSVVHAKHFEQLSFAEVGERLDISENTAKTRYYRAMDRLRRSLKDHEPDYS